MPSTVYLLPDTNALLWCQVLTGIDWRTCDELSEFDNIHLLVCHAVVKEIDALKYRGNEAVGRRARKVYKLLRDLDNSESDRHIVQEFSPTVTLREAVSIQPTPGLLDYSEVDNRVVGCTHAFLCEHHDRDVRFLTNDYAAWKTAEHYGVPFVKVPEDWHLQAQPTVSELRVKELQAENARLRASEPQLDIHFLNQEDETSKSITGHGVLAPALTADEIAQLMDLVRARFSGYRYEQWLEDCERTFRDLHIALQRRAERVPVLIRAVNRGTRPAKDALIEIIGHGNVKLAAPPDDDDLRTRLWEKSVKLPSPPNPLNSRFLQDPIFVSPLGASSGRDRAKDDPNGFYYKPEFPDDPVTRIELECQQWRHGPDEQYFEVEVYVDSSANPVEAKVECRIQADNLSEPKSEFVNVRISGKSIDTFAYARALVEGLALNQLLP